MPFGARSLAAFAIVAFAFSTHRVALAAPASGNAIVGIVADPGSGLPVSGATVKLDGAASGVITGTDGSFVLPVPSGGTYRLRIERTGYQPTDSDPIAVALGETVRVTLAIQAAPTAGHDLKTIASSTVRSTESLQRSTTIYRSLTAETLLESGTFRFGDALRRLPGITNSMNGDTGCARRRYQP